MRRWTILALIVLSTMVIARIADATPSALIWVPSTDIQTSGTGHLGILAFAPSQGSTLMDYGLTFGSGRLEYGMDILQQSGITDPVRLNAKYALVDETKTMPKFVIGAFDYGVGAASNQDYILGSKTFNLARFTFGYSTGKKSALGNDNNMAILGLDRQINAKWWVGADYQSGQSEFGAFSIGASYNFTANASLLVGYDWWNNKSIPDTTTIQFGVNF
jgi:hypothetical protein